MSRIDGIAQIALSVSDIPRATGFYRDVLGLKFLMSPSPQMAFFDCGGVRILLGTQGGTPGALGAFVYFRTPDIKAMHTSLVAQGVRFEEAPHLVARLPDREVWLAVLLDPDRNPLHLMSEFKVPQTDS